MGSGPLEYSRTPTGSGPEKGYISLSAVVADPWASRTTWDKR